MDSSRAHRLFAALDAIWIGDPTGDWITEVLGIHTIRGEWWMQIAAQGNSLRSVNVVMPWFGCPRVLVSPGSHASTVNSGT